uniref:Olfactory receptor n=1 Tax=Geotrypetes seraphini TaxID=260995 RepID=A0A6P8PH44_GEOSA|nr:olfactory receptor 1509-like [Geotrypetes seraphini]XP_033781277.1 olfactory receptor 1509-like [Geotrypetes seraphini]
MAVRNETRVTHFILLGLSNNPDLQILFFVLFLVMYLLIIAGNLLIMTTIYVDSQLHTPMYFLLCNLSLIDLSISTVTVPRALALFLLLKNTISFRDCMTQLFFLHLIAGAEGIHLVLMAYDRYVAICNPLRYTTIMNRQTCLLLVASTWAGGFFHSISQSLPIILLPFCGPNELDHFLCDGQPLSMLACSSTVISEIVDIVNSGFLALSCFLVLVISYTYIISTILKVHSGEGRQKAFSTCATHLLVVILYYGPIVFIYMRPSVTFTIDKPLAVFYSIVTPFLNPIIYTLRNERARKAMKKLGSRKISCMRKHIN